MRYDKQQNLIVRLWPADGRPDKETAMQRLDEAVKRIGDNDADIFRDYYIGGMSHMDVAAKYGIGAHHIHSRLMKVIARLKRDPAAGALLRGEDADAPLTSESSVDRMGLSFAVLRSLEAEGVKTIAELADAVNTGRIMGFRVWGRKAIEDACFRIRQAGLGSLLLSEKEDAERTKAHLFRLLWQDDPPDEEEGLARIEEALAGEKPRDGFVFRAYFLSNRSRGEIRKEFRLTRERIRQIKDSILSRMMLNPRLRRKNDRFVSEEGLSRKTQVGLLGLGARAISACRKVGIETAGDLAEALRDGRLRKSGNCGEGTISEMKSRLSALWPQGHDPEFEPLGFSPFAVRRCALPPNKALYFVCEKCGRIHDVGDMWEFYERAWKRTFPREWMENSNGVPFRVIALASLTVEENAYLCDTCGLLKTGDVVWNRWKASADALRKSIRTGPGAHLPAVPAMLRILWVKRGSSEFGAWHRRVIDEMLEKGISSAEAIKNLSGPLKMEIHPPRVLADELLGAIEDPKEKKHFLRFCSESLDPDIWSEAVKARPEIGRLLSEGKGKRENQSPKQRSR